MAEELTEEQKGPWALYRLDDYGTTFRIREGLSAQFAQAQADMLQARGHKQTYWVDMPRPGEPEVQPLDPR